MGRYKNNAKDALGREIMVGDTLACAFIRGTTARLRFHVVTKVEREKVWIDTTPVHPLINPDRYVIVKYAGEE